MDPFEHDAHGVSGAKPKFSIHDPAFKKDPKLARLRTPFLVSSGAFGLSMVVGVMAFFAVAMGDAGLTGAPRIVAMVLIGGFVLASVVSFLALSIAARRGLDRFYGS